MGNRNYLVAIVGKSSAGKDSIARILCKDYGYKNVISTTTRPMRSNEQNHIDYHFVTMEEFSELQAKGEFIEYRYYDTIQNGLNTRWHYGIERSEILLSKGNYVCVVDLVGLEDLKREFGSDVISIYIDTPENKRRTRAIGRDANFEESEWIRRNKDDDIKFREVGYSVNEIIKNEDLDECVKDVLYRIKHQKDLREFFERYASY